MVSVVSKFRKRPGRRSVMMRTSFPLGWRKANWRVYDAPEPFRMVRVRRTFRAERWDGDREWRIYAAVLWALGAVLFVALVWGGGAW